MKTPLGIVLFALAVFLASAASAQEARIRTEVSQDVEARTIVESFRKLTPTDTQTPQEISVALPVTFEFAKATLTLAGKQLLAVTASALNDPSLIPYAFLVEGHTDAVGSDQANLALSNRRAEAVRDYLVSLGVDRARLTTAGYGELRLIPGVSPTDGRQRRVELVRLP